jgi:hypothetical protein
MWIDKNCAGNTTTDEELPTSTNGLRAETNAG